MAIQKLICPNAKCHARLKLAHSVSVGMKITCPKCGTGFHVTDSETEVASPHPDRAEIKNAAGETNDAFALASESDQLCPGCKAVLAKDAAACNLCGFKIAGAKPKRASKASIARSSLSTDQASSSEEGSSLLDEADMRIEDAREQMTEPLPMFRDFDPVLFTMRANSAILSTFGACAIPNCDKNQRVEDYQEKKGRTFVKVTVPGMALTSTAGKALTLTLCVHCENQFKEELAARQEYLRDLLEPTYQELHKAKAETPDKKEIEKRIRLMDGLAEKAGFTLNSGMRKCLIATVSYGSPFVGEVEILRQYRDRVLNRSRTGRRLVQWYYAFSPPLAALLARTRHGRAVVRWLLQPIVAYCARRLNRASGKASEVQAGSGRTSR